MGFIGRWRNADKIYCDSRPDNEEWAKLATIRKHCLEMLQNDGPQTTESLVSALGVSASHVRGAFAGLRKSWNITRVDGVYILEGLKNP